MMGRSVVAAHVTASGGLLSLPPNHIDGIARMPVDTVK